MDRTFALASTDAAAAPGARSDEEPGLPAGEVMGDRFRIDVRVGSGAQGEVYRAEDLDIEGHVVALKLLHSRARNEEERDEALRELRMLAAIHHPSVIQFKEHGWYGGRLWFVMPWLEGRSLEEHGPLDREEARRVFESLAAGLAAVHAKDLRHQDIKPSNVFMARIDGQARPLPILLDFGVAARTGETLVAGSPDYFAPEIAASWPDGGNEIGPPADVFALALTLRNVLDPDTAPGVDAFSRSSLEKRAREPIAPPSGRELAYLAPHFARWLAVDPAARPTASQLARELEVLTAPEERRRERARTLRRVAPYALGTAVLVAGAGWWGYEALITARKTAATEAAEAELAQREAEAAAQRAERVEGQLEVALARADTSGREAHDALSRLGEAERELDETEGDAQRMRAARDRLRRALAEASTQIDTYQRSLDEARAAIDRLRSDLDERSAELTRTRQQLGETQATLDATRATLADSERALREREQTLEERSRELEVLSAARDDANEQLRLARDAAEEARSELAEARADLERASTEASARAAEDRRTIAELRARIEALEAAPRREEPPAEAPPPP